MLQLKDRVIVVTGAGRGIGRGTALAFALEGARVAGIARTASELEDTASQSVACGRILPVVADVADPAAVAGALRTIRDALGEVDILINNAGAFMDKPLQETSADEWMRIMAVNTLGPFLFIKEVLPHMRAQGWGRIVNVCSTASHRAYPGQSAYCASKHGLLGMTKSLAMELKGTGVRVQAVSPGGVDTRLVATRGGVDLSKYMRPEEMAEIILFLVKMDGVAMVDDVVVRRNDAEPFR